MLYDLSYADAVAKAPHLIALGETVVYVRDEKEFPWDKASDVESGGGWRLNGPCGIYLIATDAGLTFKLNIDFERRDANGRSVSLFDRDRLREAARRMPFETRQKFGQFLTDKVLPEMEKRTAEWRTYLNNQADSEDCVRGLIAYAEQQ